MGVTETVPTKTARVGEGGFRCGGGFSSPSYAVVVQVLRAARESAGLSQAELAKRLRKPPSYVAKVELTERKRSAATL